MPKSKTEHVAHLLIQLGKEYRRLQQDHLREVAEGKTRHVLEKKMRALSERFERLSGHWLEGKDARAAWAKYFYEGSPTPDVPESVPPPTFKGMTDAGSLVEVRPSADGSYDIFVDGSLERHDAVRWERQPEMLGPTRIGSHTCTEVFDVAPGALRALETFRASPNAEPPWRWAPSLYEEGLIDDEFALTSRGFRALEGSSREPALSAEGITFGVLVANGARARLFVLSTTHGGLSPTLEPLIEVFQTNRPELWAKDSELLSDSRPGLRREGEHGPVHGVSDRREGRRQAEDRRFFAQVAEDAVRLWRAQKVHRAIIVASPPTLGYLRPALEGALKGPDSWSLRELDRDLTRLTSPALHDALAAVSLLPPRGRQPALTRTPGQVL